MPYDATRLTLHSALARIDQIMREIDLRATRMSEMLTADIRGGFILDFRTALIAHRSQLLDQVDNAPAGLVAYAQEQRGDSSDVVAEYQEVKTALDDLISTIETQFPATDEWLLILRFTATNWEWRTFTPAQTSGLKAKVDALAAAVIA